jgi:hypothetical protein
VIRIPGPGVILKDGTFEETRDADGFLAYHSATASRIVPNYEVKIVNDLFVVVFSLKQAEIYYGRDWRESFTVTARGIAWPSLGLKSPSETRIFAEALVVAAHVSEDLYGRFGVEAW